MAASDQRFGAGISGIPRKSVGERRPQNISPAVLISRQDFEHLRSFALSPTPDLPARSRMETVPIVSGSAPATGNGRSSSGRASLGAVPRRTKSASENRFTSPHGERPSAAIAKASAKAKQAPRAQPGAVRRVQTVAGSKVQSVSSARRSTEGLPGPQLGLGVCGHDMQKVKSLPQQPQAAPVVSPSWRQVPPASLNALQVGGLAVQAAPQGASETPTLDAEALQDLLERESTATETGGSDRESGASDSSGEAFDFRRFRYQRTKEVSAKVVGYGAPKRRAARRETAPETPSRAERQRQRAASDSPVRGCTEPWDTDLASPRWGELDPLIGRAPSLLGECSVEPIEIEGAHRVAEILWQFYGLPGSKVDAVRVKCNVITIREAAWLGRQRQQSSYGEPPMFWVRGDRAATGGLRLYDFKGDRGTVQEFESDFLVRGVEDDNTIRMRRRDQGMLCMPFLPLPVRREEPLEDDYDDEAPQPAPAPKPAARRRLESSTTAPSSAGRGARPNTSENRPNSSSSVEKRRPA